MSAVTSHKLRGFHLIQERLFEGVLQAKTAIQLELEVAKLTDRCAKGAFHSRPVPGLRVAYHPPWHISEIAGIMVEQRFPSRLPSFAMSSTPSEIFTPPAGSRYSGFFYAIILEAMVNLGANENVSSSAKHTGEVALAKEVARVAKEKYGIGARAKLAKYGCFSSSDIGLATATIVASGYMLAAGDEDYGRFVDAVDLTAELGPLPDERRPDVTDRKGGILH
jgi:hypothetical protein